MESPGKGTCPGLPEGGGGSRPTSWPAAASLQEPYAMPRFRPCCTSGPRGVQLLSTPAPKWMGECPGLLQATGRPLGSEAMEGTTPGDTAMGADPRMGGYGGVETPGRRGREGRGYRLGRGNGCRSRESRRDEGGDPPRGTAMWGGGDPMGARPWGKGAETPGGRGRGAHPGGEVVRADPWWVAITAAFPPAPARAAARSTTAAAKTA